MHSTKQIVHCNVGEPGNECDCELIMLRDVDIQPPVPFSPSSSSSRLQSSSSAPSASRVVLQERAEENGHDDGRNLRFASKGESAPAFQWKHSETDAANQSKQLSASSFLLGRNRQEQTAEERKRTRVQVGCSR